MTLTAIRDFVKQYLAGHEVVIGVRNDRNSDGWLKKTTASGFYTFLRIMGVEIVANHADYRLLGAKALDALTHFPEPNIFLRATCLQLGFNVSVVYFDVTERKSGESKYSLKKMLRLALHGITSSSVVPLRMAAVTGFSLFSFSLVMAVYVVWRRLVIDDTIPGWASTTLPIYFIGGVQLLCLGVVGEYVGQIYSTVKRRPRWICDHKLD
jgi:polyisoprenyl-phosphate glycosyltransferase